MRVMEHTLEVDSATSRLCTADKTHLGENPGVCYLHMMWHTDHTLAPRPSPKAPSCSSTQVLPYWKVDTCGSLAAAVRVAFMT